MREYIDIVEHIMLNEYIFDYGETPQVMLQLNVFEDMFGEGAEYHDEYDPAFIEKYQSLADEMRARIESLPDEPLLPTMIRKLEDVYYDGSEAYDQGMEDSLGEVYDAQLKACDEVIKEINIVDRNPAKKKDIIISSMLKMIKDNPSSDTVHRRIMQMIEALRGVGLDYPELETIEKSIKSDIDEETARQAIMRGIGKGVKAGLVGSAIAVGMGANYQAPPQKPANISVHTKTSIDTPRPIPTKTVK